MTESARRIFVNNPFLGLPKLSLGCTIVTCSFLQTNQKPVQTMHNSVSFNITSNISDEKKLKERLREIHVFLESQNVHTPVSYIDEITGGCHINFEFGEARVPMQATIVQKTNKGRFKVSIKTKDTSFDLAAYCNKMLHSNPKEVFHKMVDHLLKVSSQRPEERSGSLLGVGAEVGEDENKRLSLSTPPAQKHMPEPSGERTVTDGKEEEQEVPNTVMG